MGDVHGWEVAYFPVPFALFLVLRFAIAIAGSLISPFSSSQERKVCFVFFCQQRTAMMFFVYQFEPGLELSYYVQLLRRVEGYALISFSGVKFESFTRNIVQILPGAKDGQNLLDAIDTSRDYFRVFASGMRGIEENYRTWKWKKTDEIHKWTRRSYRRCNEHFKIISFLSWSDSTKI